MIMILDTEKCRMDVMEKITKNSKGCPVYNFRDVTKDELEELVSFAKGHPEWLIVSYVPAKPTPWKGEKYDAKFDTSTGKWTSKSHPKHTTFRTVTLRHDKEKNGYFWSIDSLLLPDEKPKPKTKKKATDGDAVSD